MSSLFFLVLVRAAESSQLGEEPQLSPVTLCLTSSQLKILDAPNIGVRAVTSHGNFIVCRDRLTELMSWTLPLSHYFTKPCVLSTHVTV